MGCIDFIAQPRQEKTDGSTGLPAASTLPRSLRKVRETPENLMFAFPPSFYRNCENMLQGVEKKPAEFVNFRYINASSPMGAWHRLESSMAFSLKLRSKLFCSNLVLHLSEQFENNREASDMSFRTHGKHLFIAFVTLTVAALLEVGCGTQMNSTTNPSGSSVTGPMFVVGHDAPMASVVSFNVQVQSVCAVVTYPPTTLAQCIPLLSGTPTVDFARFNGLKTLLDMNDVPVGSYSQIQITLGPATIGYLNVPGSGAPTIATEAATYPSSASTYTYTATLASPLVITKAGTPVGLYVDFDLRKSIEVDGSGNITGAVTPTFNISSVATTDPNGYIDTFIAAVVSVGTQSFVVQGPHGQQFTINVNGSTEWENSESISNLTTSSIVEVSGTLDKADQTLDADDVAILSQNGFFATGQITYAMVCLCTLAASRYSRPVCARLVAHYHRNHAGADCAVGSERQ